MDTAETEAPKQSTFTIGEVLIHDKLQSQFRVKTIGQRGIVVTRITPKKIVPKEPFFVTFKNVKFKIVGWDRQREFTLHTTNE